MTGQSTEQIVELVNAPGVPVRGRAKPYLGFRRMIIADLPSVIRIDSHRVSTGYEYAASVFSQLLRRGDMQGYVVERVCPWIKQPPEIIGFILIRRWPTVVQLLNFGVDPLFRRLHVGSMMVRRIAVAANREGFNSMTCIVPETYLDALHCLKSCGFKANGVLRDYFYEIGQDGFAMELNTRKGA